MRFSRHVFDCSSSCTASNSQIHDDYLLIILFIFPVYLQLTGDGGQSTALEADMKGGQKPSSLGLGFFI
jgi:hypothetical protein